MNTRLPVLVLWSVLVLPAAPAPLHAAPTTAPSTAITHGATYTHLVDLYLNGPWEQLALDLQNVPVRDLTAGEQADIAYIKQTVGESRPAWWDKTKARQKTPINSAIWGRPLNATFDPDAKMSVQLARMPSGPVLTVMWPSDDMDKAANAEHGFTKGELCALSVWSTLGLADTYAVLPEKSIIAASQGGAAQLALSQYMDFRATSAGMYYAPPRSRRWGLFLCLLNFEAKYAKSPTVMSRRSIGALFIDDVLEHRDKYPSVKLPAKLDANDAETTVANTVRGWVEKHELPLAEDRLFRETLKSFATNNDRSARDNAKVQLPNRLTVNFDIDADAADKQARDKWVKATFDKIAK